MPQLTIGLNRGRPLTFVERFRDNAAFGNPWRRHLSFVVTAAAGFYVASLTYTQQGTSNTGRHSRQSA